MPDLRFALFGTGFWSRFQLAGWYELPGVRCTALYNRTRSKAEALAAEFGIRAVYDDPEELLEKEAIDFVDVVTDVDTHGRFVHLAAAHGVPVICQKPMAPTYEEAERMVAACEEAGVPFFVNENWRWQTPLRALKAVLDEGRVGRPFRARIDFCSSFPVFDNQPFLKELEQFILTDIGSHILDVARFLFGEAHTLCCHTHRIHQDIAGEDVATVMMDMGPGTTVVCNMSYASRTEHERFPETFVFVECAHGSVELAPDHWIRVTDAGGTHARRVLPKAYGWADPAYALIHSSIVSCQENLLHALRTESIAETHARDNLKTMQLVFASYQSAAAGTSLEISHG